MAINEGRQKRRITENRSRKESPAKAIAKRVAYSRITLTLSTFAVYVLRHRANEQHLTVSAIVETLILDGVMVPEVERLMKQSPEFARVAVEWMRNAVMRTNP
ncbi:MAG TPA: hypothetical protein VGQ65_23740 [Thermoanaerobaculia bacterium]|jgi:hypothetical protein|nr:hypothetical protein [Thermoanaerobaculia bacterium]